MSLELAIRATEILLALAFIQQASEHLSLGHDRLLFCTRIVASVILAAGLAPTAASIALLCTSLILLHRFQGPYNGGSDRMGLLILCMLCLAHLLPGTNLKEAALGYLAIQVVLSYIISGWVKVANPDWRNGQALRDVFEFSVYPVSESTRRWADHPRTLFIMSWAVMLFELAFPLVLLSPVLLSVGLVVAASFHVANACLFGLNRFVWVWIASYPSLIWLQDRLTGAL